MHAEQAMLEEGHGRGEGEGRMLFKDETRTGHGDAGLCLVHVRDIVFFFLRFECLNCHGRIANDAIGLQLKNLMQKDIMRT